MDARGRTGLTVAGVAALGASFLLGVVAAGGAGTTVAPPIGIGPANPPVTPPLQLTNAALTAPSSCEDLLDSYVRRGVERVTGWVSVLEVSGGSMAHRMVEVEHGSDVDLVRLVPLPDGRVVLVAGGEMDFFEV